GRDFGVSAMLATSATLATFAGATASEWRTTTPMPAGRRRARAMATALRRIRSGRSRTGLLHGVLTLWSGFTVSIAPALALLSRPWIITLWRRSFGGMRFA